MKIKKILLVSILIVSMLMSFSGYTVSGAGANFVDKYSFDSLLGASVQYDLNGDGMNDSFSVNRYNTYSETMGDNCARNEFKINGSTYFVSDNRHGAYTDVFITDIDQTDAFLDIILIEDYKGKSARIYQYNGQSVIEYTNEYSENYFSVWDGYWDTAKSNGNTEPDVQMTVSDSRMGLIGFTFYCGGEIHSYIKNAGINYIKTDIDFYEYSTYNTTVSNNDIKVVLNGEEIGFDQPPVMMNDRVLVPIRAIFEAMGYTVEWNDYIDTAVAHRGIDIITVQVDNSNIIYFVNGEGGTYSCDVPPQLISDRILVPVRAVSECAGCSVWWDDNNQIVNINSQSHNSDNNGGGGSGGGSSGGSVID